MFSTDTVGAGVVGVLCYNPLRVDVWAPDLASVVRVGWGRSFISSVWLEESDYCLNVSCLSRLPLFSFFH